MRLRTSQILAIGLATVLSLGPVAQAGVTPVGTLSGNDKVKLNGMSLTASQPALPGDTVEAPGAAMASIQIAPNGVARLTASGKATVERSGQEVWLNLQNGYVTVREGDQPMSVRAHGGKISGTPGTVFDVAQFKDKSTQQDNTTISVVKGSVVLSEGGLLAPRTVNAGQNVLVAFAAPGPMMAGSSAGSGASYDPAPQSGGTCNDPCKGTDKKACSDFKALKTKCGPMQKACAKDSSKCSDYTGTCSALAGCKGYGGLGGAAGAAGAAGASAGAAAASGAAAAGAATATAVTATVVTAAAAAATAVGVAVGVAASDSGLPSCASTSPANPGTNCTQ